MERRGASQVWYFTRFLVYFWYIGRFFRVFWYSTTHLGRPCLMEVRENNVKFHKNCENTVKILKILSV